MRFSWRPGTRSLNVSDYLKEYFRCSSFHGLQYLGEEGRHSVERIWWIVAILTCSGVCGYMIRRVWVKWDTSPVMVTFSEMSTPVWDIPFPAVTICSENKVQQNVFNYTAASLELDNHDKREDLWKNVSYLSLVCIKPYIARESTFPDDEVLLVLKEVGYSCKQMLAQLKWGGKNSNACQFFHSVFTEEGLCYTFNMLSPEDMYTEQVYTVEDDKSWPRSNEWSPESGYQEDLEVEAFPRRSSGTGSKIGLMVQVNMNPTYIDTICCGTNYGFKILLHNPATFPQIGQQFFRIPMDSNVVVSIKPDVMTTNPNLRGYPPGRRLCLFNSERQLRYFKIYTQANCQMECVTNNTLEQCGCVEFYMPRSSLTPICSRLKSECINNVSVKIIQRDTMIYSNDDMENENLQIPGCGCFPSCTEIGYDIEMSMSDRKSPESDEIPKSKASLNIFFKETQFLTRKRSERYGSTDFLANCGGLLSLFLGFSFLSAVELAYFFTLRAVCESTKKKNASNVVFIHVSPKQQLTTPTFRFVH